MNRSPLKQRRETPRRAKHPIQPTWAMEQNRTKDTKKRPMNAAEKRHADRLCKRGCLICGKPAEYHHERKVNGRRDHRYGAPLCSVHHRTGRDSRHTLGFEKFKERHGVDLDAYAEREWEFSQQLEERAA